MTTMSFRDAMAGFSDVLYARAMENLADRRHHLLSAPKEAVNAHTLVTFDVTLEAGGMASVAVSRYCAGFALRCVAWIESSHPLTTVSGFIHSSDGGGTEFTHVNMEHRIPFALQTSFWRSTTFSLNLRTTPALPEGTPLRVCMEIDY